MKLVAVPLLACTLLGCASTTYHEFYDVYRLPLTSVKRPTDVEQRWGEYTLKNTEDGYAYEDELLIVLVVPVHGTFLLSVENKTAHSLRLMWDEMTYVGADGFASGVSSGETRVMDVGKSQTPTVVPAEAKVSVTAIPNDLINKDVSDSGPRVRDFFYAKNGYVEALIGEHIKLIVPVRVQDTTNEYTFEFTIEDIERRQQVCDALSGKCSDYEEDRLPD